jgi:hypothetical protein
VQTTLRIDDAIYRRAKAEAARRGMTLTLFLEEALREKIEGDRDRITDPVLAAEIVERDRQMENLLERTARFRIGPHPTREEMNAR